MQKRRTFVKALIVALFIAGIVIFMSFISATTSGLSFESQRSVSVAAEVSDLRRVIKRFWPIIDGQIFKVQKDRPHGISIVWKNLLASLGSQINQTLGGGESGSSDFYWDRIFFIDKNPGSMMSKIIRSLPGVTVINIHKDLDQTIQTGIIDVYLKPRDNATTDTRDGSPDPILVFFDSYYHVPGRTDVCKVMMYHDLIPEHVGLKHGPGTQYYPRIEQLTKVDSIVAVSHSTARDLIEIYPKKVQRKPAVIKKPIDYLSNTIISVVHNRISSDIFPGPASADQIQQFRNKYSIKASKTPMFKIDSVPYDYFLTVGTESGYKNFAAVFKALDNMPDEILEKTILLMIGRKAGLSRSEIAQVKQHPLILYTAGQDGRLINGVTSNAQPIRVQILEFLDEKDLSTVYSGAIALLYLSFYEGFGLPLAEAMTSGTLTLASNTSSLPEVGGTSDTTYYVNPRDGQAIQKSMIKLATLPMEIRLKRIKKGRKWVERFGGNSEDGVDKDLGWNHMARGILQHVANSNKHRGDACYSPVYTES